MFLGAIASLVVKGMLKLMPGGVRRTVIEQCRTRGVLFSRGLIPLSIENASSWANQYSNTVTVAPVSQETWVEAPAHCVPGDELPIFEPEQVKTEQVYLDIRDDRFSLRNNHLLDEQGHVIYQPDLEFSMLPISQQILEPVSPVKGTVAYLSNTNIDNYYHWLGWILPQLQTYQRFVDLKEIDYFYLGRGSLSGYKLETLERVGITPEQVIQTGCTGDRLLATVAHRTSGGGGGIDATTMAFCRDLFGDAIAEAQTRPKRRFYVMRGDVGWRRVLNETEIIDILESYGFEPVSMDGKTVAEQAQLFAEAEAIVSVHGAALTNLMFAQPGTRVLELFPAGYFVKLYYLLASYAGADYYYLTGDRFLTEQAGNQLDILVNPNKLRALCRLAGLTD